MVKELLFIVLFAVMIYKYRSLHKEMLTQREYFIKTLSHDLKVSTLAQIRGLELLAKNPLNNDLLKEVTSSCKYTLDMINMLLNSYQFENGEQVLNYEFFNCLEIIHSAYKTLKDKIDEKSIKIIYEIDPKYVIEADKIFITKAVKEILSTSIFNSEKNSTIVIRLKKIENQYMFSIIYQGKSLTDEECRRMFNRNPRFSTVGHGIRMHLCKKILEFHGGKIKVFNYSKNINVFNFTLPVSKKEILCKAPTLRELQPFNS